MVAGVSQFVTWPAGKPAEPSQVIGIAATLIVALGGLYTLWTEQDAAKALRVADKALEGAQEAKAELRNLGSFFTDFDRLSETYRLCLTLRGSLEQASVGVVGDIDDQLRALFDLVGRPLAIAAGFAQSDRWTIGLYRAQPSSELGKAEMKCIAHRRALPCELHEARTWPEGVGIAGIAYSNAREVVIPDLQAEGMQAVFGPRDQTKTYDAQRYVSMVAVPIMVAGREKPWGVVAATSDRQGHFSADSEPGFKTDEPIRAVAAFIALAVAMRETTVRAHASSPATVPPTPASTTGRWGNVSLGSTRGGKG